MYITNKLVSELIILKTCEIKKPETQSLNTYHLTLHIQYEFRDVIHWAPLVFDEINYEVWAVKIEVYLDANNM